MIPYEQTWAFIVVGMIAGAWITDNLHRRAAEKREEK